MQWLHSTYLFFFIPLATLLVLYLWQTPSRWIRLAFILCTVFVLADPQQLQDTPQQQITLLVDRSLSTNGEGLHQAHALASQLYHYLQQHTEKEISIQIIGFGKKAHRLFTQDMPLQQLLQLPLEDTSNLTAGLQLVRSLHQAANHKVIVISDGIYTGLSPLTEIPFYQTQQIQIYALPLRTTSLADTAITQVKNNSRSTLQQPFNISFTIYSPQQQTAHITLQQYQKPLFQQDILLKKGNNHFSFPWKAQQSGLQQYQLDLKTTQADPYPENNHAQLVIDIIGKPKVLHITHNGKPSLLSQALQHSININHIAPDKRLNMAQLAHYQSVILENVSLNQLPENTDALLRNYVQHFGGGLLTTGGRNSYAMGGYYNSYLEDILPVKLDRQDSLRRPKLAMAIALDRSGSMGVNVSGGATKMDLANQGSAEAITLLLPQDEIAVFAVDSQAHKILSLQTVGKTQQRKVLQKKILTIESQGGGIFVYEALSNAMQELLKSSAENKHIVLFSDAADSEKAENYQTLITNWRDAGGTISVIGLGNEKDIHAPLLQDIANLGGGKIYFSNNALHLPRIFSEDVMRISRKSFLAQTTEVGATDAIIPLHFYQTQIPTIDGYNLAYLADQAQVILVSNDENHAPLVAAWQNGLGKVISVMFETSGNYSGEFSHWAYYATFFQHLMEWLKRPETTLPYYVTVERQGQQAKIILSVQEQQQQTFKHTPIAHIIENSSGKIQQIPLSWETPHTLSATFNLDTQEIYSGMLVIDTHTLLPIPAQILPYSPEYQLSHIKGEQILKKLSHDTQGQVFTHISQLFQTTQTYTQLQNRSLATPLLILLLCLLLLEIIQRKQLLHPYTHRLSHWIRKKYKKETPAMPPPTSTNVEKSVSNHHVDILQQAKSRANK